jgi:hypothetical protein
MVFNRVLLTLIILFCSNFVLKEKYSAGYAILIIGTLECICVGWVYGHQKFRKDVALMLNNCCISTPVFWYWIVMWKFVAPVLCVALIIISFVQYKPLVVDDYIYPIWSNVLGWMLSVATLSTTVGWVIYSLVNTLCIRKKSIKTLFKPSSKWGPMRTQDKLRATHLENLDSFRQQYEMNNASFFLIIFNILIIVNFFTFFSEKRG